jgi:hypothetical protein
MPLPIPPTIRTPGTLETRRGIARRLGRWGAAIVRCSPRCSGSTAVSRLSWASRLLAVFLAVVLVLGFAQLSWACPTCKDGLSQNDPLHANLVQGYFWSILFMMSMPFLLLSALGGYFYYEVRKARARQAID